MGVAVAGAERVPTRPVARRLAPVAIPLCPFALTFFYRFASMGGTLGGPIALTVALLGIAIAPIFYNYPKLLAYAVALPAIWWYIGRPRRVPLFLVALAGGIAFLLRHDHGADVAAASLVAVVLVHWPDVRTSVRELNGESVRLEVAMPFLAGPGSE